MLPCPPLVQRCILLKFDNFESPSQACNESKLSTPFSHTSSVSRGLLFKLSKSYSFLLKRLQEDHQLTCGCRNTRGLVMISWMWTAAHKLLAEYKPTEISLRTSKESHDQTMRPFHYRPDLLKAAENHSAPVMQGAIRILHTLCLANKHQTQGPQSISMGSSVSFPFTISTNLVLPVFISTHRSTARVPSLFYFTSGCKSTH